MSANIVGNSAQLIEQLIPVVEPLGLEIDDLKISKAGRYRVLEIVIDGEQLDLDKIALASRAISNYLDETNLMGEQQYTLEVTTRGVDSPLTKPKHWRRNVGRLVKVTSDAVNATGRIKEFNDPIALIEVAGKLKEIDINLISTAIIQVEFSRKEGQD